MKLPFKCTSLYIHVYFMINENLVAQIYCSFRAKARSSEQAYRINFVVPYMDIRIHLHFLRDNPDTIVTKSLQTVEVKQASNNKNDSL